MRSAAVGAVPIAATNVTPTLDLVLQPSGLDHLAPGEGASFRGPVLHKLGMRVEVPPELISIADEVIE